MSDPTSVPAGAYRLFAYDRATDDTTDLNVFVATAGVRESWLRGLDMRSARAARFDGFLVARGVMRNATLVWTRTRASARRRFMFYFVNSGALEVSGQTGTHHVEGHGVGLIYPGTGQIALRTLIESDFTVFTFDAQAVYPATLSPETGAELPQASPVLWAACAFLNGLLTAQQASRVQSAQVLRKMTSDIAGSLLAEASMSQAGDHASNAVLQTIDANFHNPLFSVADIVTQTGLARRTLERVCASAGFTPFDALRARRTEHALSLLLAQDSLRVHDIWSPSGFVSPEQLRRAFLHFYGKTSRQLFAEGRAETRTVVIDGLFPSSPG